MVLAPTVSNHGEEFSTDARSGPKFPAEAEVNIPRFIAWKDPIANGSSQYWIAKGCPMETDMMSTPSAIASSKAARMSAE
jgi:hypothetical protein